MNHIQQAYAEGFMKQCSVRRVDAEQLVKQALGPMDLVAEGQLAGSRPNAQVPGSLPYPTAPGTASTPPMGSGNAALRAIEDRMRSVVTQPVIPAPGSGNPTPQHPATGTNNPVSPAANVGSAQTPTT